MTPIELVQLNDSDKVQFDFLINNIAKAAHRDETGELAAKQFETTSINENNMNIVFGERAVAVKHANGGMMTRVEASIYFVFDEDNHILTQNQYGDTAVLAVDQYMNQKYGGHNKIL